MLSAVDPIYRPRKSIVLTEGNWTWPTDLVVVPANTHAATDARARRILNVVVALLLMILVLPVALVIALAVKATSRGPVLYRQTRVGVDRRTSRGGNWRRSVDYGGRLFTIYKFRTMTVTQDHAEVWARPNDPRVTPIGRFLRKYRLDELPQLINVLKGDMNIVGPRPEQPRIFMELRDQIQRYGERQRVLPGITGWAQINNSYDRDLDDVRRKVGYDLEYTARVSVRDDLKIMVRTIPVILFGKGAW
jgi:lipopolysaccharide/colanic/teichoic acid biosynthesis glycosyltransferase